MNQPAIVASAPTPGLRRAFDWWLAQVKHVLPPTTFFEIGADEIEFDAEALGQALCLGDAAGGEIDRGDVEPLARQPDAIAAFAVGDGERLLPGL